MGTLSDKVVKKIRSLGPDAAVEFFGVSAALIGQWDRGTKPVSLAAVERVLAEEAPQTDPPIVEASWEGKKVMLCLPWYRATHPLVAQALIALVDRPRMGTLLNYGSSLIHQSRNQLAQAFLKSDAEWSFWVDGDTIVPAGNARLFNQSTGFSFSDEFAGVHVLNRLISHGKTLVGGYYWTRREIANPTFAEGWSNPTVRAECRKGPRNEVRETEWIATGCLLVHRRVFEDIDKTSVVKGKWFAPADATEQVLDIGEDLLFCRRARQAGHIPHVDMGVVCGHVGDKIFGPFNTRD